MSINANLYLDLCLNLESFYPTLAAIFKACYTTKGFNMTKFNKIGYRVCFYKAVKRPNGLILPFGILSHIGPFTCFNRPGSKFYFPDKKILD